MEALLQIPGLDQLNDRATERLKQAGISADPGTIARLLVEIINSHLHAEVLTHLSEVHAQAFLSKARGQYIDMIGTLLACQRQVGEGDENYKYRISQKVLTTAAANATSIRLAALSVRGVKDVIMRKFTYGTGSGSLYVVTDDPTQTAAILQEVRLRVDEVVAWGNRVEVMAPTLIPVELVVRVLFDKKVEAIDQRLIRSQVRDALRGYVNSRNVEEPLIVAEILQRAMDVHEAIFDVEIIRFAVNGRPVLLTNQVAKWDERFVESSRPNAIDTV